MPLFSLQKCVAACDVVVVLPASKTYILTARKGFVQPSFTRNPHSYLKDSSSPAMYRLATILHSSAMRLEYPASLSYQA